jgi:hypothetical protein
MTARTYLTGSLKKEFLFPIFSHQTEDRAKYLTNSTLIVKEIEHMTKKNFHGGMAEKTSTYI